MFSFRAMRWMRTLMLPWLLPIEFTYLTCRRFRYALSIHHSYFFLFSIMRWIQTVKSPQWLIDRSTLIINFIMQELYDQQKHLFYGGRFAATTSNTLALWTGISSLSTTTTTTNESIRQPPPMHRTRPNTPHHFDAIDSSISPIRNQQQLVGQASITDLDLICVRDNNAQTPVVGDDDTMNGIDAVSHVIEYSQRHDALLAYYYLDDDNKVNLFG